MKKFILKSVYFVDANGIIQVKLLPEDVLIQEFIAYNFELEIKSDIESQVNELLIEYTPVMFEKFQSLESVPEFLKTQYEL